MNIDHDFLVELRNWVYAPRCYTPNPERLALLEQTTDEILQLMEEEHIRGKLRIEQPELPLGDCFLFVEAHDLVIRDTTKIARILERFKNIEMFSLPDGQIHFGARFTDAYTVSLLQGE